MLEKTKQVIQIEGKSIVNKKEIKGFRAVIDIDDPECKMIIQPWEIDKEACKEHRKIVRDDYAAFEDYAYEVQDAELAKKTAKK